MLYCTTLQEARRKKECVCALTALSGSVAHRYAITALCLFQKSFPAGEATNSSSLHMSVYTIKNGRFKAQVFSCETLVAVSDSKLFVAKIVISLI